MQPSILILQEPESEPSNQVALEFERAGYHVVIVPKLAVAVSWLRVNDPLLIVAPVHLLDDNIFDLLRFVRADFQLKRTKILLYCITQSLFTLGMRGTISSAAQAMGANAVLIGAVFDPEEFWKTVSPLLQSDSDEEISAQKLVSSHEQAILEQMMADQEISQN